MDHGRDVDFEKPFMEQFKELFWSVPAAAVNNARSINCEFTNQSQNNNNCYFLTCSNLNSTAISVCGINQPLC